MDAARSLWLLSAVDVDGSERWTKLKYSTITVDFFASRLSPHVHTSGPLHATMEYVLTPVVLDNGSGMIKAGYAGEEIPKSFFPS